MRIWHALLFGFIHHSLVQLVLAHHYGQHLLLVVCVIEDAGRLFEAVQCESVVVIERQIRSYGEGPHVGYCASPVAYLQDVLEVDEVGRAGFEGGGLR